MRTKFRSKKGLRKYKLTRTQLNPRIGGQRERKALGVSKQQEIEKGFRQALEGGGEQGYGCGGKKFRVVGKGATP